VLEPSREVTADAPPVRAARFELVHESAENDGTLVTPASSDYARPMDPFEVVVDGELFRISERCEPSATVSYDFSWLNGPANGTYGFSIGSSAEPSVGIGSSGASKLSREQLIAQVQTFLDSFYEDGGTGQEDFPDHVPARKR